MHQQRKRNRNQPIGIFDSGIGGLTVANAIAASMPGENLIYFGDTAHLPYGEKSADAICYYSLRITRFLIEKGCKLIVVACNSASAAASKVLNEFYGDTIEIVNVIDPLVAFVCQNQYKNIGVIATKITTQSQIYPQKINSISPHIQVNALATPLLVPMIEEGFIDNKISSSILENYLSHPVLANIEALLLACTHYPLLKSTINDFFLGKVDILDSSELVQREVYTKLLEKDLLSETRSQPHHFYVSDYTDAFEKTTKLFYKETIHLEHAPIW